MSARLCLSLLATIAITPLSLSGCSSDPTTGLVSQATPDRRSAPDAGRGIGGGGGAGGEHDLGGDDTGRAPIAVDLDAFGSPNADAGPDSASTDVDGAQDGPDRPLPPPGGPGGVGGVVWSPGNAPGDVPADQEIPVSGALVYLTTTRPPPIPMRAYCAACVTPPARSTLTDARGRFSVTGYVGGTYWLVIEKGQFRIEREIEIADDALTELSADMTTFRAEQNPDEGFTSPRIALASGAHDHLEDILGKMGFGDVNSGGIYVPESATGALDVYSNGGGLDGVAVGTLGELVRDLDRMLDYHIIFIPCAGDDHTRALREDSVLRNIRDYVAAGGNLYVTDWSGEWHDNVFPAQIELSEGLGGGFLPGVGGGIDTPASAYDPVRDTWDTSQFGNANGDSYDTPNAQAVDPDLHAWLDGQIGPTVNSSSPTRFDADYFGVQGNWNAIDGVHAVNVGVDDLGVPVVDTPTVWVHGGSTMRPNPRKPLTVTYEPAGCGRVLYSTYHTTDSRHVGLAPQERVLLYLIMEIGTCRDPKR